MLEMFFDNEKVFTIFEQIIKQGSEEILYPRICYDLKIKPSTAAEVLHSFLFLDILIEKEDSEETGIFIFNRDSVVVKALCLFDEVVGNYSTKRISKEFEDVADDREEKIVIEKISFEDIFDDIFENGL